MRNIWLLTKREYLERVRTKAFLIFTLLTPIAMTCLTVLPAAMATMKSTQTHIVVVTADANLGEAIRTQLVHDLKQAVTDLKVDVRTDTSDAAHQALDDLAKSGEITGFLWVTNDAIAKRSVLYDTTAASDFLQRQIMEGSLRQALLHATLTARGFSHAEIDDLAKPVKVDAVNLLSQQAEKPNEASVLAGTFFMLILMYMSVLIYGVNVMRSVIEEKNSRVLEVLLSSATPQEIMASKILGVGAVGITQIAIWGTIGLMLAPFATSAVALIHLDLWNWLTFAVFFLLGYLLYSSLCAAVGAAMNSEQEAQQVNIVIVLPLVLSFMIGISAMRQPDSTLSKIGSFVPFSSPIIMLLRIMLQTPPWWQIAISIGILVATIYATVWLSARIYRIGILMYGKRPTLPEIVKWLKYE